jgi:Holliday junction resolvase RusA-like endonuclease
VRFIIPGKLPNLNDYVKAINNNRYSGNTLKQDTEALIMLYIPKWPRYEKKVFIEYRWYEADKKRDPDNVAFAKKFILDSLVKKGVLKNDGWANIAGYKDEFYIDKDNPRIEVDVREVT